MLCSSNFEFSILIIIVSSFICVNVNEGYVETGIFIYGSIFDKMVVVTLCPTYGQL